MTSLDDFTLPELQVLLDTVLIREIHLRTNILEREWIYQKARAAYPMDVKEVKQEHADLEVLELWHVQVLNAIGRVALREEIQSN